MKIYELFDYLQDAIENTSANEVYIASTVLMPLKEMHHVYNEKGEASILLVQQRRISEENPMVVFTIDRIFDILLEAPDEAEVSIMAAYQREIEDIKVQTIADMKKPNESRCVAVKDVWNVHPVDENTSREAVIIYAPL